MVTLRLPAPVEYTTDAVAVEPLTLTVWAAGVPLYTAEPTVTLLAATVYVPGARLVSVWEPTTAWVYPPGPLTTRSAEEPTGRPEMVISRFPVLTPLGPSSQARAIPSKTARRCLREVGSDTVQS